MQEACRSIANASSASRAALLQLCDAMGSTVRRSTGGADVSALNTPLDELRRSITTSFGAIEAASGEWQSMAALSADGGEGGSAVAIGALLSLVGVIVEQLSELHRDASAAFGSAGRSLKAAKPAIMAAAISGGGAPAALEPRSTGRRPGGGAGGASPQTSPSPAITAAAAVVATDAAADLATHEAPAKPKRGKKAKDHADSGAALAPPAPAVAGPSTPSPRSDGSDATLYPHSKLRATFTKIDVTGVVDETVAALVLSMSRAQGFSSLTKIAASGVHNEYHLGGHDLSPLDVFDALFWQPASTVPAQIASVVVPATEFAQQPFSHPHGTVTKLGDSSVPWCGWRSVISEQGDSFASFFALVETLGGVRSVVLQDHITRGDGSGARYETLHILTASDWGVAVKAYVLKERAGEASDGIRRRRGGGGGAAGHGLGEAVAEQYLAALTGFFVPIPQPEPVDAADTGAGGGDWSPGGSNVDNESMRSEGAGGDGTEPRRKGGLFAKTLGIPLGLGKAVAGVATGGLRSVQEGVFRKAFPHLNGEPVKDVFNCALLEGALLRQGYLFATPQYLCFQSTVLAGQFALEWAEVRDLKKKKNFLMMNNSIEIATVDGATYFLTSFLQRDDSFKQLYQMWLDSSK